MFSSLPSRLLPLLVSALATLELFCYFFPNCQAAGRLAALPPKPAGNSSVVPIATVVPPPLCHFLEFVLTASLSILPTQPTLVTVSKKRPLQGSLLLVLLLQLQGWWWHNEPNSLLFQPPQEPSHQSQCCLFSARLLRFSARLPGSVPLPLLWAKWKSSQGHLEFSEGCDSEAALAERLFLPELSN